MSAFERAGKVVSIPPGASFLPTLVNNLVNGKLIDGFAPKTDPLALADVTIWVPTRRAVRALSTQFVDHLGGEAALLPDIRALGDMDEDGVFFETPDAPILSQQTIGSLERQTALARMIYVWTNALNENQRALFAGQEILMPASFADAAMFSQDLARLMDMVATEEVSWSALDDLVEDDDRYADWWKLTLQFLQIATKTWPDYLNERNAIDAATLRASWLRSQAEIYRTKSARGPVIAAGSTGSIPATSDLLQTIAHMTDGIVVLPGLDRTMNDETWARVDLPDNDRDDGGTAPGHPQFGLKRLIDRLGVERGDVRNLGGSDHKGAGFARIREEIVSMALLPSAATGAWREAQAIFTDAERAWAFDGIALIETPGEREEALAIALALREKLENPNHTAALVTPDRNLARRVAVELRRFGLDVDDSAGQPLRNRTHGTLARLVLQVGFSNADPIALVSLIKHPLARFGANAARARKAARALELAALRGAIVPLEAGNISHRMRKIRGLYEAKDSAEDEERAPWPVFRFTQEDWEDSLWLAHKLDDIFAHTPTQTLKSHAERTIALIEACGLDDEGSLKTLYSEDEGKALHTFLTDLGDQMDDTPLEAGEWPDVFDALLEGVVVRPNGGTHPRLSILGPLEARLQTYDRIVLGGLNEGTWPGSARNDPFLSRPMKAQLGLPPPERRTGLAAHDIQMLLGMEDVVITRSVRADNAPTIASRWIQRLLIVAGETAAENLRKRGQPYLDWTIQIDQPEGPSRPTERPKPCPPLDVRPHRMSVTDIETWVNDPYAIYAKKILHLQSLDPLVRQADAREKGNLYHAILEDFVRQHAQTADAKAAYAQMQAIADKRFEASIVPAEIAVLWRPRFDVIAGQFIDWHLVHAQDVKKFHIELFAVAELENHAFKLSGRADRIDLMKDGTVALFDYKTGTNPTVSAARKLYAPQLPLEAAMVARGAFLDVGKANVSSLAYVRVRPADALKIDTLESKEADASELGQSAWDQLTNLVERYEDPSTPYISKARVHKNQSYESDYDHLARVREWDYASGEADE